MSVRLFRARDSEAFAVRRLRVLGVALKIFEAFARIAVGVGTVSLACLLFKAFVPPSVANKIVFIQKAIGWAIMVFFLGSIRLLFANFVKQGTGGVFGRNQGRRLRHMALATLVLFLAGPGPLLRGLDFGRRGSRAERLSAPVQLPHPR